MPYREKIVFTIQIDEGMNMIVHRTILTVCFALFLSSCAATPVLTVKGNLSREIQQKAPIVSKVDISPDGRYALSGSFDHFILWDLFQGQKLQSFTHPKAFAGDTIAVAFSPDGKYFASGGQGTKLWDLATRQEIMTFGENRAFFITFSPDGKYILSGGPTPDIGLFATPKPPTMKLFDVSTGEEIRDFKLQQYVWSVAFSPDGKNVLSGGSDGKMDLWNISSGKAIRTVEASGGRMDPRVNAVCFSLDGKLALSGGSDNTLRLWNNS